MKLYTKRQMFLTITLCFAVTAIVFTTVSIPYAGSPENDDLKNLEALVTEFADELALLNVKVSKLEEKMKAYNNDRKSLEALTIEFADELALLNVKVSTLEDSIKTR